MFMHISNVYTCVCKFTCTTQVLFDHIMRYKHQKVTYLGRPAA